MHRLFGLCLLGTACAMVAPPVSPNVTLPPDTAQKCVAVCGGMGLKMSAVVVVADKSGCVCEPADAPAPHAAGGASAAVAGVLVALEEEASAAVQQQLMREQQLEIQQQPGPKP
jgi:hypothetical protein